MHGGQCKCFHHVFAKVLMILGFVAAILFLYTAWFKTLVWGADYGFYFMHVIVFAIMGWGSRACRRW